MGIQLSEGEVFKSCWLLINVYLWSKELNLNKTLWKLKMSLAHDDKLDH